MQHKNNWMVETEMKILWFKWSLYYLKQMIASDLSFKKIWLDLKLYQVKQK